MDIRIIKSELHATASKDLNIEQDLMKQDENLQETLKAYEERERERENKEEV
jgi:hypothetical protein